LGVFRFARMAPGDVGSPTYPKDHGLDKEGTMYDRAMRGWPDCVQHFSRNILPKAVSGTTDKECAFVKL
jgi:hypothetical protein